MNKIHVLLLVFFSSATVSAQTVFTYGNNAVSKEEFLKAYNKNRAAVKDTQQSVRDYLQLYTKFKLKVKGAKDEQLDTLHVIQQDAKNFRAQIEASYLNNDSLVNAMVDEAFQRQQKDIHFVHYYVLFGDNISPADSLVAYNAITHAHDALVAAKQKKGFPTALVNDINKDHGNYYPVRDGDLGYVTAFTLPYQYENVAYSLKPGEASRLMRTKNGWHFFMNAGERNAIGKWKVAQLFFATPSSALVSTILLIKQKADSVYGQLMKGADFAALAKQYSQDRSTFMNGGKLPEFGTGKYDTAFESQVFALKTDSAISTPFRLSDGYHIVQRLSCSKIPAIATVDYLATLKQQVLRDSRNDIAKEKFIEDLSIKTKYKRNSAVPDSDLIHYANNALVNNGATYTSPIGNNVVIFSFEKQNTTIEDWLNYVAAQAAAAHGKVFVINTVLLNQYINAATLDYYKAHLEDFNIDFKYQMQEFVEGSLLFEAMQKEVWDKAATDSAGILKYYNAHKEKYTWVKSADLVIFNCTDSFAAAEVKNELKAGKDWRAIAKESQGRIQADSNRYELSQVQVAAGTTFAKGILTAPLINMDNTQSVVLLEQLYPEGEQRNFADAKGLVINDYQAYLEAQWVAQLQKKYPVKVNDKVFNALLK